MSIKRYNISGLRQDSVETGCGMVLFGKRWLVEEMSYKSYPNMNGIYLEISLAEWESIDPTLYRLKPKRRRKAKGGKPSV